MMLATGSAPAWVGPGSGATPPTAPQFKIGPAAATTTPRSDAPDDAFARLARLVKSNDRNLAELRDLDARLAEADAYLDDPSANPGLGHAHRDRVRAKRSRVLAVLRANRLAAREFLPL